MKVLDKICGIVAVIKTTWIVLFFFTVQIPFEYERNDVFPYTFLRLFCGLWLTYSISYHYWKARIAKPIRLPKKTPDGPNCSFCSASKPLLTSHCRTCNTCIYRRDHHCPWMGQCVGIHNQAHFFLFLFNVFLSTVLVLYVEYAFWLENWKMWMEGHQSKILSPGKGAASAFSSAITVALHFIMLSFIFTYGFLVTGGFTLINMLFRKKETKKLTLSKIRLRWNQYLAIRQNDSIIRALFIPSDRIVANFDFVE